MIGKLAASLLHGVRVIIAVGHLGGVQGVATAIDILARLVLEHVDVVIRAREAGAIGADELGSRTRRLPPLWK